MSGFPKGGSGTIGGVTVSGTPGAGYVVEAGSSSAASWVIAPYEYPIFANSSGVYPARPSVLIVPQGSAHYIGPLQPTDNLAGDLWDDTSVQLVLPNTSTLWTPGNATMSNPASPTHNFFTTLQLSAGGAAQSYANAYVSIPYSTGSTFVTALMYGGANASPVASRQTQLQLVFMNGGAQVGATINGASFPLTASTFNLMSVRGQTPSATFTAIEVFLVYDSSNAANLANGELAFFSYT